HQPSCENRRRSRERKPAAPAAARSRCGRPGSTFAVKFSSADPEYPLGAGQLPADPKAMLPGKPDAARPGPWRAVFVTLSAAWLLFFALFPGLFFKLGINRTRFASIGGGTHAVWFL